MKDNPTVSVIVPTYNRKHYLIKTLTAINHNDYPQDKIEVIVVDDGSSDGTKEELLKHQFSFSLKYVFQKDKGYRLAKARNEGIKLAESEIIILLDSDMVPSHNLISCHVNCLKRGNILSIGHRKYLSFHDLPLGFLKSKLHKIHTIKEAADPKTGKTGDWRIELYLINDYLKKSKEPYWFCSGGNLAIRKADLLSAGLFHEKFNHWGREDNEWGYRLHKKGIKFVPNLGALAYHLIHSVDLGYISKGVAKSQKVFEERIKLINSFGKIKLEEQKLKSYYREIKQEGRMTCYYCKE